MRLSRATEEDLRVFLQPLGLSRRRAATHQKLALELNRRRGRFPRTRDELENLPVVGQYVANAVLVQVHDEPAPLLYGGLARVLDAISVSSGSWISATIPAFRPIRTVSWITSGASR